MKVQNAFVTGWLILFIAFVVTMFFVLTARADSWITEVEPTLTTDVLVVLFFMIVTVVCFVGACLPLERNEREGTHSRNPDIRHRR